jgi:hypothetical protein
MAIGFLRAMNEHARAPQTILRYRLRRYSARMQPSLSTIGASRFRSGRYAVRQLIDYLKRTFQLHAFRSLSRTPTYKGQS